MRFTVVVLAVATFACTASAVRYVPIDYRLVDHPNLNSLQLIYKNSEANSVCIGPDNWPSKNGVLNTSGDEFYLEVDGNKYFLKQEQDYCPNCVTKVKPNQTIDGSLSYSSFGLPETLYPRPKALHLRSTGYICKPE